MLIDLKISPATHLGCKKKLFSLYSSNQLVARNLLYYEYYETNGRIGNVLERKINIFLQIMDLIFIYSTVYEILSPQVSLKSEEAMFNKEII